MADLNDLNKPDGTSSYQSEVWQTMRAHVARLWTGDYTGMAGLVVGMRRWVNLGGGNVRLVQRQQDGSESTLFDSSLTANGAATANALALKADAAAVANALALKANASAMFTVVDVLNAAYPVGSIYFNAVSDLNPATLMGFGTWALWGPGRVPVGFDGGNTLFNAAEKTGGSADAVVVSHSHSATVTDPGHSHTADQPFLGSTYANGGGYAGQGNNRATGSATTGIGVSIETTGAAGTNANLQPYITVYMWKRTA